MPVISVSKFNYNYLFSESAECDRTQLVSQTYLDSNEEDNSSSYNFKDICKILLI